MIQRLLRLVLLALLTVFSTPSWAETFPAFTGLVVDQAGILPPDRKAALEARLEAFQQASAKQGEGRQLVVATVSSLEGDEIQDYGVQLLRAWGVGLKGADNGAILLIAPNERKIGIETGPGVSGVLTDAYSSVIINTKIRPAFKAGDLPGGIDAGVAVLTDVLLQPDDQARTRGQAAVAAWNKAHQRNGDGGPTGFIILIVIVGVFIALGILRRRAQGIRYRGGSSGMGGPVGDGSGGGGSHWPILLWALDEALSSRHSGGGWGGGSGGSGSSGGDSGGGGWGDGGFTGGGGGSGDGGGASGSW